jgi:ACS family glucarate transporter-like MFS transporter
MVAFVTGLTYVDRLNLGIVAKNFQEEFRFTTQTMGWILGAFSLGYAWFHLAGGWLADRFGSRRILAGAIIWFSAFTALTTLAPRLPLLNLVDAAWAFAIVRFLMGVGESAAFPVGNKLMGYWLGPNERALGTSIFLSGVGVAGIIAPVLITRMAIAYGWRTPFLVLGLVGVLAGLACYAYVTDRPEQNPRVNRAELALISGLAPSEATLAPLETSRTRSISWGKVFSSPSIWGLMISHFCLVYPLYIFFTWFFVYLVKVRGVTVSGASFWGSAPFVANIIMVPFWGWLSDRAAQKLGKRQGPPRNCVARHRGLGSAAVVRKSYVEQYGGTFTIGDCSGIQFRRIRHPLYDVHGHIHKMLRINFGDHGYFRQFGRRRISRGNRFHRHEARLELRARFCRARDGNERPRLVLYRRGPHD